MDSEDVFLLARAQFGLNIAFHILFPAITMALAWVLVYFRVQYARTGADMWLAIYRHWVKVFALSFAMGVVSGVVMSFQFGTNWPGYMNEVGNVAGPLLAYEVFTAFFLEATFLGIMLFGMNRVPSWMHVTATVLVACGTTLSAFWILALNSWMHTPTGYGYEDGVLIAESWLRVIFNPSFPYRFTHMMIASGLTAAFLLAGLSAWRLLRVPDDPAARTTLRTGIFIAAVLAPLQIIAGDLHGLNTYKHQPAKVAAIEALWETRTAAPFILFAIPLEEERRNVFEMRIPKAASLILTHDPEGEVLGLDAFDPAETPPVAPVFFAFRIMILIGVLMLVLSWYSVWRMRNGAPLPRWTLWSLAAFTFSGWVATVAGWMVTEIGRQPWLVTGLLKTADAVGPIGGARLIASFTVYALTYFVMLTSYVVVLTHLAGKGSGYVRPLAEAPGRPVK